MIDIGKVLRILELTSSTHDPEALVAIRKANELLEAAGMRWAQFFDELRVIGPSDSKAPVHHHPRKGNMAESEIGGIFDDIDDHSHLLSDNQSMWVERMRQAWEGAGSLSERQEEIIRNIQDELHDKVDSGGGS